MFPHHLGIIHLAGSVGSQAQLLCENPMQYPLFLPVVLPLYLSMVSSFMHDIEDTYHHHLWNTTRHNSTSSMNFTGIMNNNELKNLSSPTPSNSSSPCDVTAALTSITRYKIMFSNSCNEAVDMVSHELQNKSISTSFRSSKGIVPWPPIPYKIIDFFV